MKTRRTLIIVVAVLVGLMASGASYGYLSGAQTRAYEGATLVRVFKVSRDIPKGFSGDTAVTDEYVRADEMPQEYRPGTALTDINALRGKVAVTNLSANQVVVDGMFVDPRIAQVTAAQRIPAGQVAVTVSTDEIRGVAGLLVPGDKVNIMVQVEGAERVLFQNVNVLFIGGTAAPEAGDTEVIANPGSNLITFAVPPQAAAKIALASQQPGGVYLALVPPDNAPVAVPGVTPGNMFDGPPTPYAE